MSPIEVELLKAVAYNPQEVMPQLMSPQVNFDEDWFTDSIIKSTFKVMAQLTLASKPISWLMVSANLPFVDGQREQLRELWQSGKQECIDWRPIVESLKTHYVKRQADQAIKVYHQKVNTEPVRVRDHLNTLGLEISVIAHDGEGYDPRPSTHLRDTGVVIKGSWGSIDMDNMTDGGIPSHGFIVWTAPTGAGKTTFGRTIASHAVAQQRRVVVMSNEMSAGHYSKGVFRALKHMWADEHPEDTIIKDMDRYMSVYDQVYTFERVRQIAHWEKPEIVVLDSINAVAPPEHTLKYSEPERHRAKADLTLSMVNEFEMLMYAPGNMAEAEQRRLRDKPDTVNSVMLFNSVAYQNASDWSFVSWRDPGNSNRQNIKRCKNRLTGRIGEVWTLEYDVVGAYYKDWHINQRWEAARD